MNAPSVASMSNTELDAALLDAVEWSNWYFEAQEWRLAEQWSLRASELQQAVERRRLQ